MDKDLKTPIANPSIKGRGEVLCPLEGLILYPSNKNEWQPK